ncbi:MAG: protein translocase subunit SecDF, partial [Verrucomicrobiota bacterium]
MSGRVLWKFAVTAIVFAWSIASITPLEDSPFAEFVHAQATAEVEELGTLLERADATVAEGGATSTYAALGDIIDEESIDLSKFFPEIPVADIPKLETRNSVLMQELRNRSKGKLRRGLDLVGGVSVTFRLDNSSEDQNNEFGQEQQLNKAVEILRKRLDGNGVAEPNIRVVGTDRIEIQLPGLNTRDNPDIFEILTQPAKLEFRLVHRDQVRGTLSPITSPPSQYPAGYEVLTIERQNRESGQVFQDPYFVKRIPEAKGDIIQEAFATQDPTTGAWMVQLSMTNEGGSQLFEVTNRIVNQDRQTGVQQPLAIVLDGEL